MTKYDPPTSIRLNPETRKYLLAASKKQGWKLSRLVNTVLQQWVHWDKHRPQDGVGDKNQAERKSDA